uniref:SUEL-type lectin domain-containing protein n=1 Tax=Anopheles melas TaxID=34690 RepID=A0A182UHF0_9DIPT
MQVRLLSSTLRAFRTICCDDELLTLSCPIGTSISVELVQYGAKESNDTLQCAYSELDSSYYVPEPTPPALSTIDFSVPVPVNATTVTPTATMASTELATNDTLTTVERPKDKCTPLYVLQYSILQTVVEACQKKRRCRIQATPKNFATAPCPGIHRMVEVNHKCRPFEFRSLVSCEKDIVRLTCGQYTRIAIYSATYGRTAYESSHCSQTAASKEQTCLSEHTSLTLTEICQGRRKCTVAVESSTFGNPCPENIRVYLKVIYACVSRNVFRERYITPLEDDEQDERPYESNELYDEELTPAPNQIEGSAIGKGVSTNHNKYAGSSGESAVKAENIVTFNKDGKLRSMSFCGRYGGTLPNRLKRAADSRSLPSQINALPLVCIRCGRAAPLCPPAGTDSSAGSDYSSLLDDGHLLIVSVAVLFFCCVCLSFGALVAYKMKLFQSGNNRCIKASESTDSHSTPPSYRGPSEDFDLVECMPDTMDAMAVKAAEQPPPPQTFVQPVVASAPVAHHSTILPAFKFAEPRGGSLSQISTTMFILPNYLMAGPLPGTLSNRRPKDAQGSPLQSGDNLTITLATTDIPGSSSSNINGNNPPITSKMEVPSPVYYSQHLQPHQHHQQQQQQHVPYGVSTSCGQCTTLGWQPVSGGVIGGGTAAAPIYGGKLLPVENAPSGTTSKTSHPYHRNQSLKSSAGEPEGRPDEGPSADGGTGAADGGLRLQINVRHKWTRHMNEPANFRYQLNK